MSAPLDRAVSSLEGLSVGDAFGQQFFNFPEFIRPRRLPVGPWRHTDDTQMALGVVTVLSRHGSINDGGGRDRLAAEFARRFAADPARGYGPGAHHILGRIARGVPWREAAADVFDGTGSRGNGAAMRVAPLGAFFADEPDRIPAEAAASAEVTHAHPDGIAGAVAVAVAAGVLWRTRTEPHDSVGEAVFDAVLAQTPAGPTRDGVERAATLSADLHVDVAAHRLGTGDRVLTSDTVPFCLWSACRRGYDFEEALWETVRGLGDRDTTCAVVGGLLACRLGVDDIPARWRAEREPLGWVPEA